MSESLFLAQQIQAFLETHPQEHGWMVYEYTSELASKLSLPLLLDCLRDKHPAVLKRRRAIRLVKEEEPAEPSGSSDVNDGAMGHSPHELDSTWWKGTVEIEWKGVPIHFLTYPLAMGMGFGDFFLIATKSNEALRSFQRELDAYGQSRHKEPTRPTMYVVNGVDLPIPPVSWDDVILPQSLADGIQRDVTAFFRSRDRYRELGIPYRRGFLLTGPPGCGKTLTLKALAHNTPAKFITVRGRSDVKEDHIEHAFYLAGKYAPAVVLFEDLDKLIDAEDISLSHFLNLLDGFKVMDGVLVIATCNEPDRLDPALLHRPSRFDRVWRFPLPKYEQRMALLRRRGGAYFSPAALEEVARKTEGFSMAYVQEVVVNALLTSVHDDQNPNDQMLQRSLEALQLQRREASKNEESVAERNGVGFASAAG